MNRQFSLYDISRHRSVLMGIAMVIIVLFHVSLPRHSAWFGLVRMGNVGVDIFLFLSGIGLWFSWTKAAGRSTEGFVRRWASFYRRRLSRIYPAWFLVACAYYIPRFMEKPAHDAAGWTDLAGDILVNWDFWLHDELTFWYVPATMMLYVFAPLYMEAVRRHPILRWMVVLPMMWCIMVQYITPFHSAAGHIEIFWSRVPIFFLGINIGDSVRRKESVDGAVMPLAAVFLIISLASCVWLEQMRHGHFPLFLERMLYIPLAVCGTMLLASVLDRAPQRLLAALAWVGGISLETYLIHVEFVMRPLKALHLGYWPTALLTLCISLPAAWMIARGIEYARGKIAR